MIELGIVIALLSGGIIGYGTAQQQPQQSTEIVGQPKEWGPAAHREGMIMCRSMCDKAVQEYDPLTGECICRKN